MAAADVKHTPQQLVEAEKDRNDAARAISDYQDKVTEPAPPPVVEGRGRTPRESLPTPTDTQPSRILPNSSRLFYTCRGNRKD